MLGDIYIYIYIFIQIHICIYIYFYTCAECVHCKNNSVGRGSVWSMCKTDARPSAGIGVDEVKKPQHKRRAKKEAAGKTC